MTWRIFRRKRYIAAVIIVVLVVALIAARLYLDVWLLNYVNRTLSNIPGYQGSVERIHISLYRGAYQIDALKIDKKAGNIPTPFVAIEQADLSLQWGALLRGRVVSDIHLTKPILNFAKNKSGTATQTGEGVDWTKPIKDLMPIDINVVTFKQGKITYQDFSASPKVDVYIKDMHGEVRNLRNVEDKGRLPSDIQVSGGSIGGGKLNLKGKMNILKAVPDMDLDAKLEGINLKELSNYSSAYGGFDIQKGKLSVYSEFIVKDNKVSGYVKPIATDIHIIKLSKASNPIQAVWQVVVATVVEIFTNQPNDQFATRVPLEGKLDKISTDTWATIGGILRNAFIESMKRGVEDSVKY